MQEETFATDRVSTEFRSDFLNVFNHPIYGGGGNINTCINCGNQPGEIYGTRNDPRAIQLSLKVSF